MQKRFVEYMFVTCPEADVEVLKTGFRDLEAGEMEAVVMTTTGDIDGRG